MKPLTSVHDDSIRWMGLGSPVEARRHQVNEGGSNKQPIPWVAGLGTESQRNKGVKVFSDGLADVLVADVLVLDVQKSGSGLNSLTGASHVIFAEPFGETEKHFEEQAIGRAKRIGQKAGTVHVWRLRAAGTVETEGNGGENAQ